MTEVARERRESAKSLKKGIAILKLFSPGRPELTGPEIVGFVNMHKTNTYRMLSALVSEGMLVKHEATGKYTIGPAVYVLGSLFLTTTDLLRAAQPIVRLVNELTGEVTNLAILERGYITLVMREESRYGFRWDRHVGSTNPGYASATGKAMLCHLSEAEIDRLYPTEELPPLTPNTVRTKTELKNELQQVRQTRIAFDFEGATPHICAMGSPVHDHTGTVIAGFGVSVPAFRFTPDYQNELADLVRQSARLISYHMGYRDTDIPDPNMDSLRVLWAERQPASPSASTL